MLDALFGETGEARRVAEFILERASQGRRVTVAIVRAHTSADRKVILEVMRRVERAGLVAARREEGAKDA